ncbi:hypothetical protein UPYG_G00234980 [Umbra pygmaea]|uniref:Dynein heavy chain 5, axonemal-like n=1 Tax=Umbra pygmaea TaxID=75934 RepID=A0ABD0WE46_UMBPY
MLTMLFGALSVKGPWNRNNVSLSFAREHKRHQINRHTVGVRGHRRIGGHNPESMASTVVPSSTTSTDVSGKRTTVLSNQARKEMAKQAKAAKDQRRAKLDARHKYLVAKLVDCVCVGENEVEEAFISDEKFHLIEDFFAQNGSKKLIFFYQEVKAPMSNHPGMLDTVGSNPGQKKLFITTGSSEALLGKCLLFLRTTEKAITTANVSQEVNFVVLDCTDGNVLYSLEKLFSQIMLPALKAQENWGCVTDGQQSTHIQDLLSSVDKFICNLSSARVNMEGKLKLAEIEPGNALNSMIGPADYTAAATNSELVEGLEGVLLHWAHQIEQVLTESEQIRKESDDIGPSAELEHWKSRMTTFNSLMDEIKQPGVRKVIEVLKLAKSKTLRTWRKLDGNITVVANEAKDNVKYLYTLEKFFGPLGKCTPTSMLEHIPSLLNNIRMIHNISQSYNTSERITSLFVKVTNQMITTCKTYLSQGVAKVWDHDRNELLMRIKECTHLNEEYQLCFQRVRQMLRDNPNDKQFEFSENYIFGKFDTFCKRLEKIADMASVLEDLASLQHIKVEGIEKIFVRYQNIVAITKSKAYNVLDHRKIEFDSDYTEFKFQIQGLFQALQALLESWFEQHLTTERMLVLLSKFENAIGEQLDLTDKYLAVVHHFNRDLDLVEKLYQKQKDSPPIPRNMPPVAGRIMWSRQLFRKIELPMSVLRNKMDILKTAEMRQVIRSYNTMATLLLQYELLYHRHWSRAAEMVHHGLNASLLVRHPETKEIYVNIDPLVLEALHEAQCIHKLHLSVPAGVLKLCAKKVELKDMQNNLQELLLDFNAALSRIHPLLQPLMRPFISRVERALSPGLTTLSWNSLYTDTFIQDVYDVLRELEQVAKFARDSLECCIERVLQAMSSTALLVLPEDMPVSAQAFQSQAQDTVSSAGQTLGLRSKQVEIYMNEMIENLKKRMTPAEAINLEGSFQCLHPDTKQKTRCSSCLPCCFFNLMGQLCQRNTDALVKATWSSLDSLRRKLHMARSNYQVSSYLSRPQVQVPLFKASIELAIPNIILRPSLEEIQSTVNKVVNIVLSMTKDIPLWAFSSLHHKQLQAEQAAVREAGDDSLLPKQLVLKPLDRQLAEHKDITSCVGQLNTMVTSLRAEAGDVLQRFHHFSTLWNQDPEEEVKKFLEMSPSLPEFSSKIASYSKQEAEIEELAPSCTVGSILLHTDQLKLSLTQECRVWKQAFGAALNSHASADMAKVYSFVDRLAKRLQRPIKDLEDVREAMAALREIREAEIQIDATIDPVEESFSLLIRHKLIFNDRNAEKVDGLTYAWRNLNATVMETQNSLIKIQPAMKADLLSGVEAFQSPVQTFFSDYEQSGPGVPGLSPNEASDRLLSFQARFNELWRKYVTFSGGEELFGLTVNEYPDLQRIKRELGLLSKLYDLYNKVTESVSGYYDIQWVDLNIDKVNSELQDFQNRIRKLPKALKEWQAFRDLKKSIDDFNETCPLLHMMANKAMMPRHWSRLSDLTGHRFEGSSDSFALRNIMEAPLLKYKEDIEDVCISAVKEKDIEAKLKDVVAEWSSHTLTFASFRSRGELLLKGSDMAEMVALMEDSLMVLASLMSNRYNAPFKSSIQLWVQKLSNTTEVIEKWITVQNLWIYLEAVFVGGDIAKQLPQEAKRFQNIDKSWQKIMQRAHEVPGVVQCCVGDETLSQLLPHLLEQLEVCQKSLSGYLEKKRLVFPRFFFVSDPALLEILGQASDSHTIQAHLLSLFDNVDRVVFSEKNYDQIVSFQSQEGETVDLAKPVLAQGNVEAWLGLLLDRVRSTVHAIIRNAYLSISDAGLKMVEFQSMFPAQVGLLGIQMIWTRDAEEALTLSKRDKKIMQTTNKKFMDLLNELIDMTTRDLTRNERTKYETLITIHVHQKDIFEDLVRMNIRSTTDFEWQKQSRFYFIEDTDRCIIRITDVEFGYCNEYLGCTDRLVITPLTDRCYITLSQALGMSMGGAPAGPAGTGKTETTKDMGRCLGKYVVVFNCSDQMDYRGLGRIYKGLAQSGAWGCFDEFNRIELPVLSVAAQQIYVVLQCKKNKKTQFIFTDGDVVEMDREFGIFLTMNPGYAGRQELPENLKIQFRTVAMMVPDRAIIMRVKLASAGFRDNQVLSRKFYTLYKLCEEQLSKQVHYDFGLRNILSVLRTLGSVKRSNPTEPEKMVVMRVLRDMNLSKLVDEDEPLFMSLINDLFPGITLDKTGYPDLDAAIHIQTQRAGLIPHQPWILKLVQLYETQLVRHGMMVLGPSGAGKTTCIHTLMKAMSDCGRPHKEMRMNPKAITASQMFGTLDVATNDWTDGIFSTLWRKTLKAKKGEHIWIVLDGPWMPSGLRTLTQSWMTTRL